MNIDHLFKMYFIWLPLVTLVATDTEKKEIGKWVSAPLLLKMASWYGLSLYSAQLLSWMSHPLNLYPLL